MHLPTHLWGDIEGALLCPFQIDLQRMPNGLTLFFGAQGRADAMERVCQSLEGKTAKQKNPYPNGTLAYVAWVFARLGGWTGYYGKPGPIVMLRGLTQFHAIKHGWSIRNV